MMPFQKPGKKPLLSTAACSEPRAKPDAAGRAMTANRSLWNVKTNKRPKRHHFATF